MAVNESIVTGRYFRRCTDVANKVWQRISFWHKASDCEFDDGQTAQTKAGAIKGITTSTSVTETGYAADMTTVKNLQTQINELNSNLGEVYYLGTSTSYNLATLLPNIDYTKLTADNFIVSVNSMPSVRTNTWTNGECHPYARATGLSVSKSYNKDTGKLSISASQRIYATNGDNNSDVAHVDQSCSFKVYLVTGSIKSV